jgi:ribosomal protein L31
MKLGVALFVLGALTVASSLKMIPLRSAVQLPERKTSVNDIWQACATTKYPLNPIKVVITPDPPKKGQDVSVNIEFSLNETVTSGNVNVKVDDGVIPLYTGTFDLCETLTNLNTGLSCPLAMGKTLVAKVSEFIPSFLPSVSLS